MINRYPAMLPRLIVNLLLLVLLLPACRAVEPVRPELPPAEVVAEPVPVEPAVAELAEAEPAVLEPVAVAAPQPHGVLAAVHPLAVRAGMQVLSDGGNAVDAAVAAALVLGVVDGYNSGIGGGCLILVRTENGELLAIDGRETAPKRAHREMFLINGEADPNLSRHGALAVGTPGSLAAYRLLLERAGTRSLATLLRPAAELAERGFVIDERYHSRLQRVAGQLRRDPGSAAIFLTPNGQPWPVGTRLRQPALALSYRAIANDGVDWFYRGAYAGKLDAWMKKHGGILRAADLDDYRAVLREPIRSRYRDYAIIGFPPPSSGGVHVAQILNILDQFPLKELSTAERIHLFVEAEKRAFADRAFWLGDADFVPVPRGLADSGYAAGLAAGIDLDLATPVAGPGTPPDSATDLYERHTTHIAAADEAGNWVAITATLNTSFGAKVTIPGTGIVLNNQMDDFSAAPGVPNSFGLVGAEANAVAPGKRPLSSMSPTLVLQDEEPLLTLGAAGGPTIISQVAQVLINRLDLDMSLEDALAAPRVHHQWLPDRLRVEGNLPAELRSALKQRRHHLQVVEQIGVTQAVGLSADGQLEAVVEPRLAR